MEVEEYTRRFQELRDDQGRRLVFRQVERQGSTEKEGTGLGLAIAHKQLLGGSLTAESEVGVGTTFVLRLESVAATA